MNATRIDPVARSSRESGATWDLLGTLERQAMRVSRRVMIARSHRGRSAVRISDLRRRRLSGGEGMLRVPTRRTLGSTGTR